MASTLKKTAVAGGLLGLALLTFLKTKKGRIIKDRLKEHTQDLYTEAEEKLREFGNSSKEKYDEAVAALVRQYSQKKMLATETVVDLTRELQKKWKVF